MENSVNKSGKGMAITSLVCGIVALIISFAPCVGIFGIPFAVLAIVFGAISLSRSRKEGYTSGMSVGGLATSITALIISVAWLVAIVKISNNGLNFNMDKMHPKFDMFFDVNGISYDMESVDFDSRDTTLERLETVLENMNDGSVRMSATDSTFTMTVEDGESKVTIGAKKK